jgi:hypothetical protein
MRNWFVSKAGVVWAVVMLSAIFMAIGFLFGHAFPQPDATRTARLAIGPLLGLGVWLLTQVLGLVFSYARSASIGTFKGKKVHVVFHQDGRTFLVHDDERTPPDSPISE